MAPVSHRPARHAGAPVLGSAGRPERHRRPPPMHQWAADRSLVDIAGGESNLVLLIRGELLRRYPNTVVLAIPASGPGSPSSDETMVKRAIFAGFFDPDVAFFGFDLTDDELRLGDGWFFALQEQITEPRFGLDESATGRRPPRGARPPGRTPGSPPPRRSPSTTWRSSRRRTGWRRCRPTAPPSPRPCSRTRSRCSCTPATSRSPRRSDAGSRPRTDRQAAHGAGRPGHRAHGRWGRSSPPAGPNWPSSARPAGAPACSNGPNGASPAGKPTSRPPRAAFRTVRARRRRGERAAGRDRPRDRRGNAGRQGADRAAPGADRDALRGRQHHPAHPHLPRPGAPRRPRTGVHRRRAGRRRVVLEGAVAGARRRGAGRAGLDHARRPLPPRPGALPARHAATDQPRPRPNRPPAFPATATRASSWTRAVEATALPERWVAIGFQDTLEVFRIWSDRVPDRLAAGPSPEELEAPPPPDADPRAPRAGRVPLGARPRRGAGGRHAAHRPRQRHGLRSPAGERADPPRRARRRLDVDPRAGRRRAGGAARRPRRLR